MMQIEWYAPIEATIVVAMMILGMRILYGSWPWETEKTWYATRRLLPSVEQTDGTFLKPKDTGNVVPLEPRSEAEDEKKQ